MAYLMRNFICFLCLVIVPVILIPYGTVQMVSPSQWAPINRIEQDQIDYWHNGKIQKCTFAIPNTAKNICYSVVNPSLCDNRCGGSLLDGIMCLVPGSLFFMALVLFTALELIDRCHYRRELANLPTIPIPTTVVQPAPTTVEIVEKPLLQIPIRTVQVDCPRRQIELGKSQCAVPIVIINP